ncbi:MAG: MucR family transcriptional regulator [Rhodospirillaceae bacterium]
MSSELSRSEKVKLTVSIVSAHMGKNNVAVDEIPTILGDVYKSINALASPEEKAPEKPEPAVPIKKSIHTDYLVCLEDGKKLKMLKRHLKTAYGLTPEEYREKWGLPADYPMVAPSYASKRSSLAKQIGLGTRTGRNVQGSK